MLALLPGRLLTLDPQGCADSALRYGGMGAEQGFETTF
jgi:hypothetical protein